MIASESGNEHVVQHLISKGADVHAVTEVTNYKIIFFFSGTTYYVLVLFFIFIFFLSLFLLLLLVETECSVICSLGQLWNNTGNVD